MTIINNALTGSLAAQVALTATSQNIANLQTKGYTRQGVLLTALQPTEAVKSGGNGVEVSALIRFSDDYKNQQMWRSNSEINRFSHTQPYLTQLERVMGDATASLSAGVDGFFAALNASDVDPTSTPLRQQVVSEADSMAQHFNSMNNVVSSQLLSLRQQRSAIPAQANEAIAAIALMNQNIVGSGAAGTNVSALIDARDQAIDALAGLMALEVTNQADGTRDVSLKSGPPLVIGSLGGSISVTGSATGTQTINLTFETANFVIGNQIVGGQMGGLGEFEEKVLLPLQQSIADIAENIATRTNDLLTVGFDMDGAAGQPLFTFNAIGSGASGMLRLTGITATQLAFSADAANPGNSDNLVQIIALMNTPITVSSIGSVLLGDADTQLVGKLGIDSKQNIALLSTADTVRSQAISDWQSTSGVNRDEEAVDLVEFQNMFQANMKVIAVANSLFDATLAMMN
ncbi:MAG: flagellar hook-associated protein FlgK [Burkholderiaceae bacterium]|nr:flagellar hook-associated protein FlgK [Burkholderiaceae bacterium]